MMPIYDKHKIFGKHGWFFVIGGQSNYDIKMAVIELAGQNGQHLMLSFKNL
jgi:hypothetical protein